MPVVLDTGVLLALIHEDDPKHSRATTLFTRAMTGRYGAVLSTDHVLAEGLAYLRKKVRDRRTSDAFAVLFLGMRDHHEAPVELRMTPHELLEQALELHFNQYERGLSLVDCSLIVHANAANGVVATFDAGFAGLVPVVDA